MAGAAAQHRVGQPAQVAQGAQAERAPELAGGPLALGPPGGVRGLDEQAGRLAVHDDEGRLLGDRHRVGGQRVKVDGQRVLRRGAGDGERIEQADVCPRRPLRLLLGAGQRHGMGIVAQGEQHGHREGRARREAGADRDRAGDLDAASGAAGWRPQAEEPGGQECVRREGRRVRRRSGCVRRLVRVG